MRDSLTSVARDLGMPDPGVLALLHERWEEMVGPQLSRHARPASLLERVLTIEVDDASWATQVRYLEDMILQRSSEHLGEGKVGSVRVVVGRSAGP